MHTCARCGRDDRTVDPRPATCAASAHSAWHSIEYKAARALPTRLESQAASCYGTETQAHTDDTAHDAAQTHTHRDNAMPVTVAVLGRGTSDTTRGEKRLSPQTPEPLPRLFLSSSARLAPPPLPPFFGPFLSARSYPPARTRTHAKQAAKQCHTRGAKRVVYVYTDCHPRGQRYYVRWWRVAYVAAWTWSTGRASWPPCST